MVVDDVAIPGLERHRDWITADYERELLLKLGPAGQRASGTQRNRIERYGPGVSYSGYTEATRTEFEVPLHLAVLATQLGAEGVFPFATPPNAITVGWYLPGQHVLPHIDSPKAGDVIAILGLGGDAQMRLAIPGDISLLGFKFARRMLVVLRGDARWKYTHEIAPVPAERISIVFRHARRPLPS